MSALSPTLEPPNVVENAVDRCAVLPRTAGLRMAAYLELAKARIALMVLISMGLGFVLASRGVWQPELFLHACVGVFLAVVSSSTLNQYLERETDRRMVRTARRPLPTGRLTPAEVLAFGIGTGVLGVVHLLAFVNPLTAWLTLGTIVSYVGAYTPLKRRTPFCTAVGAVPGAAPPVLGWVAAGGELDAGAFALFAILFVWQFPHFLAIAWIYRDQYAAAGLRMLPGRGRPRVVALIAWGYSVLLIPISLLPLMQGLASVNYAVVAVAAGMAYAFAAFRFMQEESRQRARRVLWVSLAYLPCVQLGLILDHLRRLG